MISLLKKHSPAISDMTTGNIWFLIIRFALLSGILRLISRY
ncbi:hypothetical protein [uncultured Treponema sp.]|nr:hypothetical protein [uncultured Treponema sp.]